MKVWSIEELLGKLERNSEDFGRQEFQEHISGFMFHTIILFEEMQKQLDKKEDKIDVNDIKEVKLHDE